MRKNKWANKISDLNTVHLPRLKMLIDNQSSIINNKYRRLARVAELADAPA